MQPRTIRPATAADQSVITTMIRTAQLNPFGLDWRRFVIAEDQAQIVGMGQIKRHGAVQELASLVIAPTHRSQGIGTQIIRYLLARATGPLYLMCNPRLEGLYARFGFVQVPYTQLPPYFRRIFWVAKLYQLCTTGIRGLRRHPVSMMRREPDPIVISNE